MRDCAGVWRTSTQERDMPLRPDTIDNIKQRLSATSLSRQKTRAMVEAGNWLEAEDNPTRSIG
jgi:hypothetical protein